MMQRKILVIDDEADVRQAIHRQLTGSGLAVIEASDGEDGIRVLNTGDNPTTVDAIICDVRMPRINGVEAVAYFRHEHPAIPIIVLTGYPDVHLAEEFLAEGVVDYLVKPVEKTELVSAINKATGYRATHHPASLTL